MSELKVNTIQPATGSQVTVQAQVLGVPGTDPNHFATVSQLGGVGPGGITRAEIQELVDIGVAEANRHSDEQDVLQNTQTNLDITTAKQEAITTANAYTDSQIPPTPPTPSNFGLGQVVPLLSMSPQKYSNTYTPGSLHFHSTASLPDGTGGASWWVTLTGYENQDGQDEDGTWQSSYVWSVPAGQYLTFAPNAAQTTTGQTREGTAEDTPPFVPVFLENANTGVSYMITGGTDTNIDWATTENDLTGDAGGKGTWDLVPGVVMGFQDVWTGSGTDACVYPMNTRIALIKGFAMKVS